MAAAGVWRRMLLLKPGPSTGFDLNPAHAIPPGGTTRFFGRVSAPEATAHTDAEAEGLGPQAPSWTPITSL